MQGTQVRVSRLLARILMAGGVALLLAASLPARGASGAPAGSITMNPANVSLDVGETVNVTIDVTAVDLNRIAVGITYNAAVLEVIDEDGDGGNGTQILEGPFPGAGTLTQNSVSSGIINYQYELGSGEQVSGSGTLATVQFEAIAEGNGNLAFTTRQLEDAAGVTSNASASAAVIVVGNAATATATAAAATNTPPATNTASATATVTSTPVATTTGTPAATSTATATRTATRTATPGITGTPAATSTARITILQNSNASPTPSGAQRGITNGVDPSQAARANGLPSAGNEGPGIAWWRWTFFGAALMLGVAGWFFTFAVHYGDRDVVLMDRFDARRRQNGRKLPRR